MKELLNQFDLDNAFKALDEMEYPTVKGGIRPNRMDLHEHFSRKPKTDLLIEEYYNVSSDADLMDAQEQRNDEIAQAKLDRIEKIVDLDADSEEDLQAAYVGKYVIQCPQCMTLFYKKPEDVTTSEEDPTLANVGELCPNCSNDSGFTVVGKIEDATPEAAPVEEAPAEEGGLEEMPAEGGEEAPAEGEEDFDLDLDLGDLDLDIEGTEEREPTEESLNLSKALQDASKKTELDTENHSENLTLNESNDKDCEDGKCDESINNSKAQKDASKNTELDTENHSENLTLNEDINNKVAIFFDCSGSNQWSPAQVEHYVRNCVRDADMVEEIEIFYFSDALYPTQAEARQSGSTSAGPAIIDYAKEHPDFKVIVYTTDDDLKGQGGAELYDGSIPNVKVINLKVEEALHLTESADVKAELKDYNEYIEYLQKQIAADEEELKKANNDFVKDSIQRRLDGYKADLDAAMPQILKDAVDEQDVADEEVGTALDDLDIEADVSTDAATLQDESNDEETEAKFQEALNEGFFTDGGKFDKLADKPISAIVRKMAKINRDRVANALKDVVDKKLSISMDEFLDRLLAGETIMQIWADDKGSKLQTDEQVIESCEGKECKEDVNTNPDDAEDCLAAEAIWERGLSKRGRAYGIIEINNLDRLANIAKQLDKFAKYRQGRCMIIDASTDSTLPTGRADICLIINMGKCRADVQADILEQVDAATGSRNYSIIAFVTTGDLDPSIVNHSGWIVRVPNKGTAVKEDVNILSGNSSSIDLGDAGAAIGAALPLLADDEGEKLAECDKALKEAGEPSEAELDRLYDSKEFRTPVPQSVIDNFFNEDISDTVQVKDIEELDDDTLTETVNKYLKEVYENVDNFKLTNCQVNESTGQLFVEGDIRFKSGKTKPTAFAFNSCGQRFLEGYNFDLCETKAFKLYGKMEDKKFITEGLGYRYHIYDDLVKGIARR